MSKSHPYRIQLHCDKKMHSDINKFAEQKGITGRLIFKFEYDLLFLFLTKES